MSEQNIKDNKDIKEPVKTPPAPVQAPVSKNIKTTAVSRLDYQVSLIYGGETICLAPYGILRNLDKTSLDLQSVPEGVRLVDAVS